MQNKIFIGDNLNIMNGNKLDEFIGKVGLVYIDPPYNNGSSFSYNNNHTSQGWFDFMKQRIEAAYKYMKDESAIFVSIDDAELVSLKTILDSVFKPENFVGIFITKQSQRSNAKHVNTIHEYILCYAKRKSKLPEFKISRMNIPEDRAMIEDIYKQVNAELNTNGYNSANKLLQKLIKENCQTYNISWLKNYNNLDKNGKIFFAKDLSTPSKPRVVNIPSINLHLPELKTRGWTSDKKLIELYYNNRLSFKGERPYSIHYLEEAEDSAPSILNFYSRQGTNALKKLGIAKLFDTPKPVELIKFLIRLYCKKNDYIMDFFAGSGTTAQAVYETNIEDNAKRKYILIQLDEEINPKTEVYQECNKLNIIPKMQYILKCRIDTFLKSVNKQVDYDFYDE